MTSETDLASRWLGGSVIAASDESFGEKENLLNPAPAAFEPGHYGPRGEIVTHGGFTPRSPRAPEVPQPASRPAVSGGPAW